MDPNHNNQCVKCGKPTVIAESSPDGKTKTTKCLTCGNTIVEDVRGKPLLTEVPSARPGGRQLLMEG